MSTTAVTAKMKWGAIVTGLNAANLTGPTCAPTNVCTHSASCTGAGIAGSAMVVTATGLRPAGALLTGDRVVTYNGMRSILEVSRSAGAAEMVSVARGVFRASAPLLLTAGQVLLATHRRAGRPTASAAGTVRIGDLVGQEGIARAAARMTDRVTIRFQTPEFFNAEGVWLQSCTCGGHEDDGSHLPAPSRSAVPGVFGGMIPGEET